MISGNVIGGGGGIFAFVGGGNALGGAAGAGASTTATNIGFASIATSRGPLASRSPTTAAACTATSAAMAKRRRPARADVIAWRCAGPAAAGTSDRVAVRCAGSARGAIAPPAAWLDSR
ncbi:MAG TPA: hypothetical protein VIN75_23450 [Burkholderiaceae bacterium]